MAKATGFRVGLVLIGAIIVLYGCATDEELPGGEFGASYRHMIAVQTATPGQPAPTMDGPKAEATLKSYRGDVAKPKQVEKPIIIDVGGRRGR